MLSEKFKTMVVAKESKVNKNGEPYGIISVMDGSDVLNLITKDNAFFNDVELFKQYEVQTNIKWGQYPKQSIHLFVPCK